VQFENPIYLKVFYDGKNGALSTKEKKVSLSLPPVLLFPVRFMYLSSKHVSYKSTMSLFIFIYFLMQPVSSKERKRRAANLKRGTGQKIKAKCQK
jgi:hypothetical protein